MIVYLSLGNTPSIHTVASICPAEKLNILSSFQYKDGLREYKPRSFRNFMADSGAFTAMNTGKRVDDNYVDEYIKWINENNIDNFIEMDLDEIIGYEDVLKLRKKIEIQTGKKPIPVWHNCRGAEEWKRMCYEYPYVAISLSLMTNTSKWLRQYNYEPLNFFMAEARKTGAKVHALGCNNLELMKRFRFYSVDSSMYAAGNRFGTILDFKDGQVKNINREKQFRCDYKKIERHTIEVMMEITKYAEQKL